MEVGLDDVFDLVHPGLLEVVRNLAGGRFLDLVELADSHRLGDVGIVDVPLEHVVAFLADLLHGTDGLVLVQDRVEAEIGERLWEIVWRNDNHAVVRCLRLWLLLWQGEWPRDEVGSVALEVLVENDLVHRLREFKVHLAQQGSRVRGALSTELLGVLGHAQDSVDLVVVDLWDLVRRHVLNVEIVLEKRVSHGPCVVCNSEPLGKLSGVLVIEQDIDSVKPDFLSGVLPIALVPLGLGKVSLDLELSPEAEAISVLPETLGRDFSLQELGIARGLLGAFINDLDVLFADLLRCSIVFGCFENLQDAWSFQFFPVREPVSGSARIQLLVVIGLQRQPASWSLGRISEFNILYNSKHSING